MNESSVLRLSNKRTMPKKRYFYSEMRKNKLCRLNKSMIL